MSDWNRTPDSRDPLSLPSGEGEARLSLSPFVEGEGLPSWLRPFSLDGNTRFTRTPDSLMRARAKGRDGLVSPLPPLGMPDPGRPEMGLSELSLPEVASAEPQMPAPSARFAIPDDLAEDEVFIDWTGGTWSARAEAAHVAPQLPGSPEPQSVATFDDGEETGERAEAPIEVLCEDEPACAPQALEAPAADAPQAEAAMSCETSSAVAAEPSTGAADLPVEAEIADHLRPLARLILLSSTAPFLPAADQDRLPPAPVEATGAEDEMSLAAGGAADELALPCEAASAVPAANLAAPEGIEATPSEAGVAIVQEGASPNAEQMDAASSPGLPEADAASPSAAPAFFSWGATIGGGFGWAPLVLGASPAPEPAAPPEAEAPKTLKRRVTEAEPETVAEPVPEPVLAEPRAASPASVTKSTPTPTPTLPAEAVSAFEGYELPPLDLLTEPPEMEPDFALSEEALDRNSAALQQTLRDFGVRGEVIDANPGPVVTLYEFEPAPGTKSSRVIGLSADIARSMSAVSARVAVVEGRNVIGIELPNQRRETVWLRELLADQSFADARGRLGIALGKTIGGEPVIADLARMPHLLVAGTTGSGKSVAINTMILSLLYRLTPEQCRLIMIDPKMLELSVYEGIPHLLTPVVTDPKKAIIALQWAVREMEDRYRKMARLKVRNIEGFNARVAEAREKGEVITFTVDKGFDKETGETLVEEATLDLTALPYIVIIVDEMADLMMVAGKDIEGAIQRLAQMARAAGIHLVMATQRPSVDVITGTIKANFPTRISFQVTSKIDSRTILGEMGAETLLGQGDMLYMANGGRITRVHGPFVSDGEVEHVVAHLKAQGRPEYLDAVTASDEEEEADEEGAVFDRTALGAEDGADNYEQAVALVLRDRKASTSYIQRRLQIGYNKAASLMERMEQEGIVGPANHAGKREILVTRQV
ncbi:MAG: DNA translocase FtsK [Pseudomonadota bacterium]